MPQLVLDITGRNLASRDSNGLSDPYCILKSGSYTYEKHIAKVHSDPSFGRELAADTAANVLQQTAQTAATTGNPSSLIFVSAFMGGVAATKKVYHKTKESFQHLGKTDTIYKTLNPNWGPFIFQVPKFYEKYYIECWDKDFWKDDLIGICTISNTQLDSKSYTLQLYDKKGQKSGTLNIVGYYL